MQEIVIASAVRTAIGSFNGPLASFSAPALGSVVIKEAVARAGIKPEQVDEVIMGNVLQAGLGQNTARQAAVHAGLPYAVPAMTVNKVCGSGLKTVILAAQAIIADDAAVVVAGGMESMTNAPFLLPNARWGHRMGDGQMVDSMIRDGLWCAFNDYHMGITAENVAEKYGITRTMQDEFSADSQQKAQKAIAEGKFKDEIVPIEIKVKKKAVVFDTDEAPRAGVTVESLSALRPAFKKDGTVTAGNASGINDAASAVVLMTEEKAKELGVKPMATWIAGASARVDPAYMGLGPIGATKKIMAKTGLAVGDMDLIEANEAFAAQSIAVCRDLAFDMNKVNVNGGAIALGHPVGCSGARILTTLMYEMQRRKSTYGLATLCVGGGMGVATIVKMGE